MDCEQKQEVTVRGATATSEQQLASCLERDLIVGPNNIAWKHCQPSRSASACLTLSILGPIELAGSVGIASAVAATGSSGLPRKITGTMPPVVRRTCHTKWAGTDSEPS